MVAVPPATPPHSSTRSAGPPTTGGSAAVPPPSDPTPIARAIGALIAGGLHDDALRLLGRFGLPLLRAGHGATVDAWESALAADGRSPPLIPLLRARALAERSAPDAQEAFVAAHAAALAAPDTACALQAAAGALLNMFTVWRDFRRLPAMLAYVEEAVPTATWPDHTGELEALTGLMAGWLLRQPDHAGLPALAERMFAVLGEDGVDAGARLHAGGVLLGFCQVVGDLGRGQALVTLLDGVAARERVAAGSRLVWEYEAALFLLLGPDPDIDASAARVAAHRAGLPADIDRYYRFNAARLEYEVGRARRDWSAAEAALGTAREALCDGLHEHAISLAFMDLKNALSLNDFERARHSGATCVAEAERIGMPDVIARVYRQYLVQALMYSGHCDEARAQLDVAMRGVHGRHRLSYAVTQAMIDVVEAFAGTDDAAREAAVRACLDAVEKSGSFRVFGAARALGAQVTALALERDIHATTARKVIDAMGFAPPPDAGAAWPWPLKLHLLGVPAVELDGRALESRGRGQQRPLELLMAIAAHQAIAPDVAGEPDDRGVEAQALMLMLWPGADSDARTAFDVTLSRLRKLLGHDGLVALSGGRVRLDPRRVWCDAWSFVRAGGGTTNLAPSAVARALALYRGPLLGELGAGGVPGWAIVPRERLRARFLRAVERAGADAEARGDWRSGVDIYERGLFQDGLAEPFHRGLMRCHIALGAPANALRAYRQLRELLAAQLGVVPEPDTQALYRTIHAAG